MSDEVRDRRGRGKEDRERKNPRAHIYIHTHRSAPEEEEKMTRVILRSIRLSLITSNYSCGSVSYVLITSRNEAGDL